LPIQSEEVAAGEKLITSMDRVYPSTVEIITQKLAIIRKAWAQDTGVGKT